MILYIFLQIDSVYEVYLNKLYSSEPNEVKSAYEFFKKMSNARSNKYDLYFCAYSLQILYFSTKEFNKEKFLDEAIKLLEKAIKIDNKFSEAYALLSGLYGIKAGMNIFYGMFYGPKAGQMLRKALEIDSLNPRVMYTYAQNLIYAPPAYGGNFEKGVEILKRIINKYENGYSDSGIIKWGYKESIFALAIAYEGRKDYKNAYIYYKKLLDIEPNNEFYKNKVKEMERKSWMKKK